MSWLALAGAAISETSKSPGMTPDNFSPYQPINVAPVGVNIGEILREMNSGGVTNGGQPVSIPLDLGWSTRSVGTLNSEGAIIGQQSDMPVGPILLGVGGLVVLGIVLTKRRA